MQAAMMHLLKVRIQEAKSAQGLLNRCRHMQHLLGTLIATSDSNIQHCMVHLTTHDNNDASYPLLQEPGFLRNAVAYYRLLAAWLLRMAHPPLAQGQMPHVPLPEPVPVQFRCLPVRAASWQACCPAGHCEPA